MFVFPLFMFFIAFLYFCFIFTENFEQTKKKTMKNNTPFINWKKGFDQTKEEEKIGYDFLLSDNIQILVNNFDKYLMNYYVIVIVIKGEITFFQNNVEHRINNSSVIILQPRNELQFVYCSDNIVAVYCVIAPKTYNSFTDNFEKRMFFNNINSKTPIISLNEADIQIYLNNIIEVKSILSDTNNPYRLQSLRNSVISHHYKLVHKHHSNFCKTDFNFTNSFFNLLEDNFVERRDSSFYAKKLCKSKVQFDFIIKRDTGKTPTAWIEEKLANEIKKDLNDTSVYISQISEKYKFTSISSFSKFFSRVTGITPSNYRKENSNR